MADKIVKHNTLAPGDVPVKFKDILGDGSQYALTVSLEPGSIAGGSGGGAASIADGADVAQGTTTDVAWVSGAGSMIALSKAKFAKLEAIRAQLASSVAVTGTFFQAIQPVSITAMPSTPVTGTFWQATQPVSGPLTDAQLRTTAVPVSLASAPTTPVTGTFWQTTQPVSGPLTDTQLRASAVPVSLGTNTPDVTDRAARLLGHVTVDTMPTTAVTGPLTDTQLRASAVPVSLATAPSTPVTNTGTFAVQTTLAAETTKVIGTVNVASAQTITVQQGLAAAASGAWTAKITDGTNVGAVKAASTPAAVTDTSVVVAQAPMRADAANLGITNTAATGVACTLTIPAAGSGLFHYISLIEIQLYATAARTGGATPVLVTTTNLPGLPVWDFDTAQAIGVTIRQATQPATPIKSSAANTATTIVAPIATTGIWRITAYYYAAP